MADDSPGGVSIAAPTPRPQAWWGSFGGRLLCSEESVAVASVSADWSVAPKDVEFYVHTVRPEAGGTSADPFYSALGRAPDFSEPYSEYPEGMGGEFEAAEGATVDMTCAPYDPAAGFQELVVVVEAGAQGAAIESLTIDYEEGDEKHQLRLNKWELVLCGDSIDPKLCPEVE